METNNIIIFECKICNFFTKNRCNYKTHLTTKKHLKKYEKRHENKKIIEESVKLGNNHGCEHCGKQYKYHSGLSKHLKVCKFAKEEYKNDETVLMLKELMTSINKKDEIIKDLVSKVGNTTNNYNTMTLNVFLNTECSNAMNLTDFMDSLKLNLEDLQYTRDNGYIKGITNIFVKNLNQLEPKERPIHCSDKKNQQFYIKDENVWSEDTSNKKIDKSIDSISKKQILKIKEWEKENPDWANTESGADLYMNMVKEVMGTAATENKARTYETIKKDLGNSVNIDPLIENGDK